MVTVYRTAPAIIYDLQKKEEKFGSFCALIAKIFHMWNNIKSNFRAWNCDNILQTCSEKWETDDFFSNEC